MRSDAKRNRDRLLAAATDVILEVGPEPPLDAIARRAGVGIATLYRNFPDRATLIQGVAARAFELSAALAEDAGAESDDGFKALRQYMHAALDQGIGVLNLIHSEIDPHPKARTKSVAAIETILQRARRQGSIRGDVTIPDIGFAIIRFSRPVARGLPSSQERAIAHRHLDIYVDGLGVSRAPLPHPAALDLFDPTKR